MAVDPFPRYAIARSMCAGAERGSADNTALHSRIARSTFPCCRCSEAMPSCRPCCWARGVCAQAITEPRRKTGSHSRGTVRLYRRLSALRIGLIQHQNLAAFHAVDRLLLSAGPLDLDAGNACGAQPEIQTRVAGAKVT